jgi:hypothetical protein
MTKNQMARTVLTAITAATGLVAFSGIAAASKESSQKAMENAYKLQVMVEGCNNLGATRDDFDKLKRHISALEKSSGLSVAELKHISDTLQEGFAMAYSKKFCEEVGPAYLRDLRSMPVPH